MDTEKDALWKAYLAGFMESTIRSNGEIYNYGILIKPEDVARIKNYFNQWLEKESNRNSLPDWAKDYSLNSLPQNECIIRDIFNLYDFKDVEGKRLVDSDLFRQMIEAYCMSPARSG